MEPNQKTTQRRLNDIRRIRTPCIEHSYNRKVEKMDDWNKKIPGGSGHILDICDNNLTRKN